MVAVYKHHEVNLSAYMVRLRNPQTGLYLHMSGEGETEGRDYAWSGLRQQARNLRAKHVRDGKPWPYKVEFDE